MQDVQDIKDITSRIDARKGNCASKQWKVDVLMSSCLQHERADGLCANECTDGGSTRCGATWTASSKSTIDRQFYLQEQRSCKSLMYVRRSLRTYRREWVPFRGVRLKRVSDRRHIC
jgi:hypothetical protein